jgi:hypothetical protein
LSASVALNRLEADSTWSALADTLADGTVTTGVSAVEVEIAGAIPLSRDKKFGKKSGDRDLDAWTKPARCLTGGGVVWREICFGVKAASE